ncbi:substrate-binding domain-containing protein, partial [Streptomyces sp. NPDC001940]
SAVTWASGASRSRRTACGGYRRSSPSRAVSAYPLLALLRQSGRAVPEDVSVVAVCPEQVAAHASVPLTSVAVPAQEMGRRAVEQVIAKIEGRGSDEEVVLLAPELTVRESAAQAPAGA